MNRTLLLVVPLLSGLLMPSKTDAQVSTAPIDPFGQIFSATVRPEAQQTNVSKFAAAPAAAFSLLGLGVRDSSSATTGSFSFGYGNSISGHDVLLLGSYSRVDPEKGKGANRVSAYGEFALASTKSIAVSVVGTAAYDPDAFKTYSVVLVGEHEFIPNILKATANLGWATFKPDGVKSTDDFQPAVGVSLSPGKEKLLTFSVDYTFKNNVDGEDSGSFAAACKLQRISSVLKFSAEKHNVYGLSLTRIF